MYFHENFHGNVCGTFVEVTSMKAFVEAFSDAFVKTISSEAFSNAFVEASKEVSSMEFFLETLVRVTCHGYSHEIIRGNFERFRGSKFHGMFFGSFLRTFLLK